MQESALQPRDTCPLPPTRPIRIAQVIDSLSTGGAERVAVNLANNLFALGYPSYVIATRYAGDLGRRLSSGVTLYCAGRRSRWDVRGLRRIVSFLDEHELDIVHSHNHTSSYLVRLVRLLAKRKPIHVVHDHHGPAINNRRLAVYDWLMLRNADAYITVSDALRARALRLLHFAPGDCLQIDNGIEIGPATPPWHGPPTVVHVANIRPPKGHATAVRAAALLSQGIPGFRWICVGNIPEPPTAYVTDLRSMISSVDGADCVELAGPSDDIRVQLSQAHVGVLTSDAEGLPMTLLEYMASELPVVVTDVGQCGALVREAEAGLVVPSGDHEAIAAAVCDLISKPDRGRSLGERGRAYVQKRFSAAAMAKTVSVLYDRLLQKSS